MLEKKAVEFFAHQNGVSLELAEREVVLTHALQLLEETHRLDQLAFKGGTCIRKVILGPTGRFSMDLDFTACQTMEPDEVVLGLENTFNRTHHDIEYKLDIGTDDWRVTQGGVSLTVQPTFRHEWNDEGGFDVQVSFREQPTLPLATSPQVEQPYFKNLPFKPVPLRCLQTAEILSEKIRAAYQRAKVRDLHDLYVFSTKLTDRPLLRRLVAIKLWQVKDPFDPKKLFHKIENADYDWEDLKRLVRRGRRLTPVRSSSSVFRATRFSPN